MVNGSLTVVILITRIGCGDSLVNKTHRLIFGPLFLQFYNNNYHFPGGHTPTEQEVKTRYAPLAQKMLMEYSVKRRKIFPSFDIVFLLRASA